MKPLRCFRELRLKKIQNIAAEDQFYVEYESLRRISGTADYRDFLAQNCTLSI